MKKFSHQQAFLGTVATLLGVVLLYIILILLANGLSHFTGLNPFDSGGIIVLSILLLHGLCELYGYHGVRK